MLSGYILTLGIVDGARKQGLAKAFGPGDSHADFLIEAAAAIRPCCRGPSSGSGQCSQRSPETVASSNEGRPSRGSKVQAIWVHVACYNLQATERAS